MTISIGMICNCSKFLAQMPMTKPIRQKPVRISTRNRSISSGWSTCTSTNRVAVARVTSASTMRLVTAAPT